MPIKLVIAEDQRLFRQSLRLLLEQERDLRVVGEATDGQEAVTLAHVVHFDGIGLPSGVYFYRLASEGYTETKTMLLVK